MKTMKFLTVITLVLFIGITTTSCSGDDGDTGPQGTAGVDGTNGTDGVDGNANVMVKTITPDPGPNLAWTVGSYLGTPANVHSINDTDITQDVLDNSLIIVYFQLFGEDTWYPMTYSFVYSSGGGEIITYTHGLSDLSIYAFSDSGTINAGITKLKYFIIEGSSTAGKNSIDYTKVSYEEMINHFDLEY